MATPRCRGVRCSHPCVPVSKGHPPLTLLVQILCFIESELSLLLLPSRRSPLSRSLLRLVRSFHGCQTRLSLSLSLSVSISLRVVWNQPGVSMNFINKTTSASGADKATTDRRYACISVWSRRAWKICTAPNPLRGKEARPAVGSRFSKAGQARRHRATYRPRGRTTFVPRFQEPSATLSARSHKLIASNPEETGDFFLLWWWVTGKFCEDRVNLGILGIVWVL